MAKRSAPEVNAGSMADIAFLLLIFFLVTTTIETDSGISRRLPPIDDNQDIPDIRKKNIFIVLVNKDDQLLVNDDPAELKDLRQQAIEFLDNGGGVGDEACDYCQGPKDPSSSDNPDKAVISLQNDRLTSYKMYIAVQNELVAAYNDLRDREAQRLYGQTYREMEKNKADPNWRGDKEKLDQQLSVLKAMYPQKLSEAEPKRRD
ncbi:ExbD/TolR family protein [Planktosalinus lacus]|uniref:Biopolymer transporter ExbD n=1 Tax=Planktosalinus lacus TaxID=1526573 RepID=A0A8J2V808_9FLAO|nr:biopolymer transporter ExbD [Planktosalinus lacus]GGD82669.1 biopolymer transporter ExbD [Planktosalinus lacus]